MADNSQREPSEGLEQDASSTALPLRKACDACRSRKIRCDRNCPCSQCLQTGIPCIKGVRSRREKRDRASLSNKYEEKIDLIDRRLETITQLLQDIQTHSPSPGAYSFKSVPTAQIDAAIHASSSTLPKPTPLESPFGSSSASHPAFSNDIPRHTGQNGRLHGLDADINETVDSLHSVLGTFKQQTSKTEFCYPLAKTSVALSSHGMEMPPIEKTVALLQGTKFDTSVLLHDLSPWEIFQLFTEQSEEVLDNTESLRCAHLCRTNIETALLNLPLYLPASMDSISALLLGAFHTMEISKPSLCWTLSSKASELSQTLGYHRIPCTREGVVAEENRHRQLLFWFTYFIDKSLSLRLGRASTIQDWDITTPMVAGPGTCSLIDVSITMWINTARCQGKIYENLYSPDSILQPDHVRKSRILDITGDLQRLAEEACDIKNNYSRKARDTLSHRLIEYMALSDDVLRLSLLTLVYRASPTSPESPSVFIPNCLEAARATLQRHQDFVNSFADVSSTYFTSYVHWTLLFAPFTPFIVLFCHIIESPQVEQDDLDRLDGFLASISAVAPTLSDAAFKMHRLFEVLSKIAQRYTVYRSSTMRQDQAPAEQANLNAYLTALGFQPMNHQQHSTEFSSVPIQDVHVGHEDYNNMMGVDGQGGTLPTAWIGHTTELGEWFEGNQHMMNMLEGQDLVDFSFLA